MYFAGQYTLATGRDLRDAPLHLMYDVAYECLRRSVIHTEEEHEAFQKVDRLFVDLESQSQTGLPAMVTSMGIKPADEM